MNIYAPCHDAGGMSSYAWEDDPKRLAFMLARYKHTAKILAGKGRVLEVGCSDGFGSRIVRQHVGHLTAVDVDPLAIREAKRNASPKWPVEFFEHDIMRESMPGFDAAYCLDVLEHIAGETIFLRNLAASAPVCVIGTPSLESQKYASPLSKEGHINCKSGEELRETLLRHWRHVFLFSMNDETIHTGFSPMAHYLLAVCVKC